MRISILGAPYTISSRTRRQDKALEHCDGYCDTSVRAIVVREYTEEECKEPLCLRDLSAYRRKCLRHEITHAFLYESGLSINSAEVQEWAHNEEMVDWVAIQGPKLYAAWQQAGCL